jgi:hypothetical protein
MEKLRVGMEMANSWFDPPLVSARCHFPPAPPPAPQSRWAAQGEALALRGARGGASHTARIDSARARACVCVFCVRVRGWAQQIMYCAFGGLAALISSGWYITTTFGGIYAPVPALLVAIWYNFIYLKPVPGDTAKYITFHADYLEKKYAKVRAAEPDHRSRPLRCTLCAPRTHGATCPHPTTLAAAQNKIPISVLYETYVDGDLEFKGDVLVRAREHCCPLCPAAR